MRNWSLVRAQLLYLWLDIFVCQNKMQTDQDEQQNQGDSPKEPEENPHENEEMEVRRSPCVGLVLQMKVKYLSPSLLLRSQPSCVSIVI